MRRRDEEQTRRGSEPQTRLERGFEILDAGGLVTYVNYPSTEYLELPFLDVTSFNVYVECKDRYESYLARLQNIARRFHALAVSLGGLMIKVGQFMSSRLDVLAARLHQPHDARVVGHVQPVVVAIHSRLDAGGVLAAAHGDAMARRRALVKRLLGGRGGGSDEVAQGGGASAAFLASALAGLAGVVRAELGA